MSAPTNHARLPVVSPAAREPWRRLVLLLDALPDSAIPCRATDPEAWWPDRKQLGSPATLAAIAACGPCAAREPCAGYAVAAGEREGVWGGLLPGERRDVGNLPT